VKVTEITVNAGRTFNHPFEQYSNLRPSVTLRAVLEDGEDALESARKLQAQAETLVEDHKQHLLDSIQQLEDLRQREREIVKLESLITNSQQRLASLRTENGAAQLHFQGDDSEMPY